MAERKYFHSEREECGYIESRPKLTNVNMKSYTAMLGIYGTVVRYEL